MPEPGAPAVPPLMRLFNLLSDPKEETDIKDANPWAHSVDGQDRRGLHGERPSAIRTCRRTRRDPYVPPDAATSPTAGALVLRVDRLVVVDGLPPSTPPRVASTTSEVGEFERERLRDIHRERLARCRDRRTCAPS